MRLPLPVKRFDSIFPKTTDIESRGILSYNKISDRKTG